MDFHSYDFSLFFTEGQGRGGDEYSFGDIDHVPHGKSTQRVLRIENSKLLRYLH